MYNKYRIKIIYIGMWADDGKLVALATYECPLGEAFLIVDEHYTHLIREMVAYAKNNLHDPNGKHGEHWKKQ